MSSNLDPRLNAHREDLADETLRDMVEAPRYVAGEPAHVTSPFADMLAEPDSKSSLQTQILFGHDIDVFDKQDGWSWVQRRNDGYVGYVRSGLLCEGEATATHMVFAPRTFLYPGPDLKFPRCGYRSMGSRLNLVDRAETRGTRYGVLEDGSCIIEQHIIEIGDWQHDPVFVAEKLLHTPYLWGGDTGFGIDCSGLVFLSNMLCGETVLRDSDMLAVTLGEEIEPDFGALQRGDIVFWKGHCGMMADGGMLLHANGNTMNVALEPLADAIERIGYLYGQSTRVRRPQ
ncbi:MAG: NlpC/P60 family protein [Rhizobiaceae bacterium]